MNVGKTVFSQLMEFLPPYEFQKCVERYQGNYKIKFFSCRDQFFCMGFRGNVSRNTLAHVRVKERMAPFELA